jgi:NPCBM/NEW2 domain
VRLWLSKLIVVVFAVSAHLSLGAVPGKLAPSQMVLLDGSTIPAPALHIKSDQLSGDGVPANLTLDDLWRIERLHEAPMVVNNPSASVEIRGGRLLASKVSIANEKCLVACMFGESLSLPVDLIRAVRLKTATTSAAFEKALTMPSSKLDRIFVTDETGEVSVVTGLVESLEDKNLKLVINGQMREVPRAKIFGIVVAQPAVADTPLRCAVTFVDGSALSGTSLSLAAERATLTMSAGGTAEFAWSVVSRVTIRSSRVAFLSDLKPIVEEQQPLVTLAFPARRDRSVSGRPLTLGSRTYEKGLGVHARSLLTFQAERKWDVFAATIGLDSASGGKGDCIFKVLADGETILAQRMQGTDLPRDIQLPITGREQLTLLVDPGEGLDLADHANWCDARFIQNKR